MTRNATLLHITEQLFTWIVDSGMVDLDTGTVYDGVDTVGMHGIYCTVELLLRCKLGTGNPYREHILTHFQAIGRWTLIPLSSHWESVIS